MCKEKKLKKSWVSEVLALLFWQKELHVPSKKLKNYRNKITYNLPLDNISPLAEVNLNDVCQSVHNWIIEQNLEYMFREVMAKNSREGLILIRITVQRKAVVSEEDDLWDTVKHLFSSHMVRCFPNITCICYNETFDKSRPTKDSPIKSLFGDAMYLLEKTPTGLEYQISPDSFCEINHEVEDLQYKQTVSWIEQYQGAILVCSGRDINSYGLGFGSICNREGKKIFSEVIAIQHCPLVGKDAKANFKRHEHKVKGTVLQSNKDDMASSIAQELEEALERQNRPDVVVVTTGGRKGLSPSYLKFLKAHKSVKCIIYNSCSTKSLEVDIEAFMTEENGFHIDDFRSYDFFAGTKYSASVLRLLRRPKVLVLPIGPAGCGKSTLSKTLIERSPPKTCRWWHRDYEFAFLRNEGISLTKSKSQLHHKMLSFLTSDCRSVRILDSTNGNEDARKLYISQTDPGLTIFIVMRPTIHENGSDLIDILLERTRDRLENGCASHPSFPTKVDEQRVKHAAILKGIKYPTVAELDANAKTSSRRTIISCNPLDESKISSLPFEIFLQFSLSASLNKVLTGKV